MRKSKYTKELLEPLVASSSGWSDLIRKLNLKITGGNFRNIQGHVHHHGLDCSHFVGQAWSTGLTAAKDVRVRNNAAANTHTCETALVANYPGKLNSSTMKRLLLETGRPYVCENGHLPVWMDQPMSLHIDHINGINNDNRPENLRFLCPNCHQQTKTWGNGAGGGIRTPMGFLPAEPKSAVATTSPHPRN